MPKQGPYPHTDRDLIRRIERSPNSRAGYKQLIRELGLGGGRERRLLLEQLTRITARGELVKINNEQWSLPAATPEKTARVARTSSARPGLFEGMEQHRATRDRLVAGKLDLHRDGFGFVRPSGSADREEDIFIPPNEINGAMQGDEVLVDEAPRGRDGRRSGRVARVLTRRNPTVVGIFHYARPHRRRATWENMPLINGNYVTPLDERMTQPILIPDGAEVPATPLQTPHRVLGQEAQVQQQHWSHSLDPDHSQAGGDWLEGLAVDIEVTDFPTPGRPARGRVLEVLGPPDAFGVDVEIVIRKHHLPHIFPANVLAEAGASAEQTVDALPPAEREQRRDFRGLPIVTIDGETARDFDDAVVVLPLANGNWQLQVHIADVSHYVRPGTDLDLEARLRGTSVYFPDRAIPMLPSQLSSGMCSLRPEEDRLVLSCLMEIDAHGEVLGYEICEGIIRSQARLTYTLVQALLDKKNPNEILDTISPEYTRYLQANPEEITSAVAQMYQLALRLNAKRKRRGSVDFDLPEPVVQFDPDGNMQAIVRSQRGWSHRLIEEFMLSANECVAHWIEAKAPGIYRIHETPDPKRILDFEETASQFGYSLGFSNLPVKRIQTRGDRRSVRGTDRKAQTHEVAESIPVTPQMYQRLTAKISGKPEERILAYLMLRSLKQARYSEKNVGHFALASPSYTHFTSPIRRFPDLIVHRLLRDLLNAGASPEGGAILSTDPQPWGEKPTHRGHQTHDHKQPPGAPSFAAPSQRVGDEIPELIPAEELAAIASESSQSERRADDAERELIEWKKVRFMQDRVGEDFHAIILSCTKYGFFVELDDLFIEGLVPLASLSSLNDGDFYSFRDTDRTIVGNRYGRVFKMGQRVHVLLDRIDRQQRRLQFAVLPSEEEQAARPASPKPKKKKSKTAAAPEAERPHLSPNRSGKKGKTKSKTRLRDQKAKGKKKKKK
ncbi:MAG TPA: RNB domain-containing ribonuclease [Granulicella sp.]|jgi:ribonuclease R|nr:RNB domain-containing ribonuclease [Granulicella sp.]